MAKDKKTKVFNVTGWPASDVDRLDEEVRRVGGGEAHGTRASRGTVLLSIFRTHLKRQRDEAKDPEEHPGWESFITLWEKSPKKGSRAQAWRVWRGYWDAGDLPEKLDAVIASFNHEMTRPGGWREKAGTEDEKFIPHFRTWLSGPPWASLHAPDEDAEPTVTLEEARLRDRLRELEDSFPDWWYKEVDDERVGNILGHLRYLSGSATEDAVAMIRGDYLPGLWASALIGVKAAAREATGGKLLEIKKLFLSMVRQRRAAEAVPVDGPLDTWDDVANAARTNPDLRRIAGETFLKVLHSAGVPRIEI